MTSSGPISIDDTNNGRRPSRANKLIILTIGVSVIVGLTILSLSVATLVKVNEGFKQNQVKEPLVNDSSLLTLASSIQVDEVMIHLKELQRIADISDGNRAVRRPGFNRTIDYIFKYLESNTDHIVTKRFFSIRQFQLTSNPILVSSINGTIRNYTFSENLSTADFYSIELSTRADFSSFIPVTTIPNLGCSDADWQSANPPPAGRIALVKRGICTHVEKGQIAMRYNVSGLLIYNDGATPDRVSPISISLGQENEVPALYLSAPVGQALADAVRNPANTVSVQMVIDLLDLPLTPIGNICADTKTGDATRTIIIGSHSDSVPAGPGINDNG